ncbi:protein tailless [Condylostylus longicornis]|uniref:protein tailless n=1 Tax=Condylostylus longicornis TaxID=2530218 RepID=UPI00244E2F5E|nr:protein tailless [Condylostylus longicornis]
MNKDSVQHERGPRNSTLRRQMAIYKEALDDHTKSTHHQFLAAAPQAINFSFLKSVAPSLDLSLARIPPYPPNFYIPTVPHHIGAAQLGTGTLPITSSFLAAEQIRENAAKYLFENLNWTKNIATFTDLPMSEQLVLLEKSWKESFILSLAHFLTPINFSLLIYVYESENLGKENYILVSRELPIFQQILNQLHHLAIDKKEYDLLQTIILFKDSEFNQTVNITLNPEDSSSSDYNRKSTVESSSILKLHEDAKIALIDYTLNAHKSNPGRYQNLIDVINLMSNISSFTIEELFFRKTIGNITMFRLISDMYSQKKS